MGNLLLCFGLWGAEVRGLRKMEGNERVGSGRGERRI